MHGLGPENGEGIVTPLLYKTSTEGSFAPHCDWIMNDFLDRQISIVKLSIIWFIIAG